MIRKIYKQLILIVIMNILKGCNVFERFNTLLPSALPYVIFCCILATTVLDTTKSWSWQMLGLQVILCVSCVFLLLVVFKDGNLKTHITYTDVLIFLWWIYILVRTCFVATFFCSVRLIVTYTILLVTYIVVRFISSENKMGNKKIIELFLLFMATYEILLGLWQIFCIPFFAIPTGSFFNSGPYSAYVVVGMTVALRKLHDSCYLEMKSSKKAVLLFFCIFVLLLGCFIIAVTKSRSAIVVMVMVVVSTFSRQIRLKQVVALSILGIVIAVLMFFMKKDSAIGRIVIWQQALGIIEDNAICGTGLGTFSGEYGKQLYSFFSNYGNVRLYARYADVADYAFCDVLQVFVEQGFVGGMFCISFCISSLFRLYKYSSNLGMAFLSIIVFGLFSYPMQLLPFQIIAISLAAFGQNGVSGFSIKKRCCVFVLGLCAIVVLGCLSFTLPRVKAHTEYELAKEYVDKCNVAEFYRLLPLCNDDKHFLFDFATLLQANHRDAEVLPIIGYATRVSGDPMFWILLGNSNKTLSQYNEAVNCYNRAFVTIPNRLYPLYKIMMLHYNNGDVKKAQNVAYQLLKTKPKIISDATETMRHKAKVILKNDIGK